MKVIGIIAALMVTGCVTYPKYVKEYRCDGGQKYRLPEVVLDCIDSTHKQKQRSTRLTVDYCHDIALRSVCTPVDTFKRVNLPTFQETKAINCNDANTFLESFVCDMGE